MDSLEKTKKSMAATNEAFKDDIVAQALIEEYVLKLFSYADAEDRAERFNKNVIKVAFESHLQHLQQWTTFTTYTDIFVNFPITRGMKAKNFLATF